MLFIKNENESNNESNRLYFFFICTEKKRKRNSNSDRRLSWDRLVMKQTQNNLDCLQSITEIVFYRLGQHLMWFLWFWLYVGKCIWPSVSGLCSKNTSARFSKLFPHFIETFQMRKVIHRWRCCFICTIRTNLLAIALVY